jgi:hypothetical protein
MRPDSHAPVGSFARLAHVFTVAIACWTLGVTVMMSAAITSSAGAELSQRSMPPTARAVGGTISRLASVPERRLLRERGAPADGTSASSSATLVRATDGNARPSLNTAPKRRHRGRSRATTFVRPRVLSEPRNQSVVVGERARFSARATGRPTPKPAWQVSTDGGAAWSYLAGSRSDVLTFVTTAVENNYLYRTRFANRAGTRFTRAARLDVMSAPVIEAGPADEVVVAGASGTFTAAASGNPVPTVTWQSSSNDGGSWTDIAGATSTSYAFTASTSENGFEYRATFSNRVGSATTSAATLTVGSAPSIAAQPTTAIVQVGQSATFNAGASGSPSPTVQWGQSSNDGASWTPILGATSNSYSVVATAALSGERFEAVFTNQFGSATTLPASLAVTVPSPSDFAENWSGYSVDGSAGTFDAITGSWTVPTLSCGSVSSGHDYYSVQWIGIDGDNNNTVEQDGTEADCVDGSPSYEAWWALIGATNLSAANDGDSDVELDTSQYPVLPGDVVESSVTESPQGPNQVWTFAIADYPNAGSSTPNWTFNLSETVDAADYDGTLPQMSSVEWITERPELCLNDSCSMSQIASLAPFGSVTFSDATAAEVGSSAQTLGSYYGYYREIEMTSDGTTSGSVLSVCGPLESSESFATTWTGTG